MTDSSPHAERLSRTHQALPEGYFDWDEAKQKEWIREVMVPAIHNLREPDTEEER
jgi:hypothetical protein